MIVFDQLKKNDTQLQLLALCFCLGLGALLAGLWWVQIVNAGQYRESLETQSFRTIRIPGLRGKILDRNGVPLADNRPSYNVNLYLEDLSSQFRKDFKELRPKKVVTNDLPFWKDWLNINPVRTQYLKLNDADSLRFTRDSRYRVGNRVVTRVAAAMQSPLSLDYTNFFRHYETRRFVPYPIAENISPVQVARFEEQGITALGLDLEIQPTRVYPNGTSAAHLLGYMKYDDSSVEGEDSFYWYRMADYRGLVGIEGGYNKELRGRAGVKSVQVNNLGYRQSETVWTPAEPGRNVVLTIDLRVQQAAEDAIRKLGPDTRAAAVVMHVQTGDIVAMVSSPVFDPGSTVNGFKPGEWQRWNDEALGVQKNRATREQYQAGSIFKTIVALAALENGLDKNRIFTVDPNPHNPNKGGIYVGRQVVNDTAPPGPYDLKRAITRSSNSYFIQVGALPNVFDRVVELGRRLHLGERMGVPLLQEAAGHFPKAGEEKDWNARYKANICIGQGEMDVTPLQMAVMTCALANGGKVLMPRFVDRLESQSATSLEPPTVFPRGQVRDHLGVGARSLQALHEAMLAETEDDSEHGTGRASRVEGLRICGKTGTAERTERGVKRNSVWFISFAPYENPQHAVAIMVEDGASGGGTCAPIAHDIYLALQSVQKSPTPTRPTLTASNR